MNSVDKLKQRIVEVWNSLQHYLCGHQRVEKATESMRAVHANGQHFEHLV